MEESGMGPSLEFRVLHCLKGLMLVEPTAPSSSIQLGGSLFLMQWMAVRAQDPNHLGT